MFSEGLGWLPLMRDDKYISADFLEEVLPPPGGVVPLVCVDWRVERRPPDSA